MRFFRRLMLLVCFLLTQITRAEAYDLTPDFDYAHPPPAINIFDEYLMLAAQFNQIENIPVDDFIPQDLTPGSSGRQIASRIVAHSAKQLVESPQFRNTPAARSAQKLDSKMSSQLAKDEKHRLEIQLKSTQTMASIRYVGFGQTLISYRLYDQAFLVELSKSISSKAKIVLDHLDSPEEKLGKVSLRWTW